MTRRRKKSSNWLTVLLIVAVLVIAAAAGIYYAASRAEKDVEDGGLTAPAKIELLEESKAAQKAVDDILLTRDNWQLTDNGRSVQMETAKSGAQITWNKRELAIGVPAATELRDAAGWLADKLEGTKLKTVRMEETTYNDWDSVRLDIAISTKAGEGTKEFVTDVVYFYHNLNLDKPDKDIKKEPATTRSHHGKLAVIIDDCGYDIDLVRRLVKLNAPFSFAIIPYRDYSSDVLHIINGGGQVAMLHLPMEPMDPSAMSEGKHTVLTSMDDKSIRALTRDMTSSLPGISGVNNHQGSKATSDERAMTAVLKELKSQGLFFVDSNTYSKSLGDKLAAQMGVPTGRNNIFLDNSTNEDEIIKKIWQAAAIADKYGSAIAICHARPHTVNAWEQAIGEVKASGLKLVPVTEVLH